MRKKGMHRVAVIVAAVAIAFFPGCSKDSSDDTSFDIRDQTLQGQFDGKSFSLVSGYAEDSYPSGTEYEIDLFNVAPKTSNPWDGGAYPSGSVYLEVAFSVPQAVGTYKLSLGPQTATLYDPANDHLNIICDEGSIRIDSISGGYITGAMAARQSDDHDQYVNGTFSVPIKPY